MNKSKRFLLDVFGIAFIAIACIIMIPVAPYLFGYYFQTNTIMDLTTAILSLTGCAMTSVLFYQAGQILLSENPNKNLRGGTK